MCGSPMKENGHDRFGSQRWMCTACDATRGVRYYRRQGRAELDALLAWLLGSAPQPLPEQRRPEG
ncbi:transposase for IS3509a [Bifidobacterium italicum]|uniref:Transposase for IS3509a n=2 Tax=Bifidobacterium italicum TaxID=1960968 RepID=A0A2A2EFE1_9BIFI|nr:transposase for IS3509a [Bifidobacterium italicum]